MGIIVGFSLILCLIGLFCIFFPQYFVVHEDSGVRIRISVVGIVILLVRSILGLFPVGMQKGILRSVGVLIVIGSLLFGVSTISKYHGGIFRGFSSSSSAATGTSSGTNKSVEDYEEFFKGKDDIDDEYRQVLVNEGPAYTEKVLQLVSAKNPGWHIESPGLMMVTVVDRNSLISGQFDFTWAIYNGTSPEERAEIILEESGPAMVSIYNNLKASGEWDKYFENQKVKYPHLAKALVNRMAREEAQQTPQQSQSFPPLEVADDCLTKASAAWKQGKKTESLEQAKAAWQIRNHHLGREHPKTKEVENMILSVQNGQ